VPERRARLEIGDTILPRHDAEDHDPEYHMKCMEPGQKIVERKEGVGLGPDPGRDFRRVFHSLDCKEDGTEDDRGKKRGTTAMSTPARCECEGSKKTAGDKDDGVDPSEPGIEHRL